MKAEPIRRRKLAHEVLDRMLERMREGEFPVGSTLPSERELMEFFSVGRPAVREALQAMERMGFIAIVHGEGAKVLPVTASTIISQISESAMHLLNSDEDLLEHLKNARAFFEVNMVRTVIETVDEEGLKRLKAALEENRADMDDQQRFHEADMEFHRTIAKLSGNPIFFAVSQAMLEWLRTFHSDLVWNPGQEDMIIAEHEEIYNLIAARDADGAARAMANHLARANQRYQIASTD
ncbi:transcriptional regulator, GntR family [Roseovarius azorensis]|uniref:Transcriptional regulator, GntR family n=1 Tax=Roseovarius azorensis TaxID=1287727 RepID=A0A1H7QEQ0_9RHOB|nr:transcriptional regulator NanR [Roseovarius azorensis]SEL46462.1 transcriptional regulator, GntR family [Roseovarius azorensis]